jgi:hypothetical protein
MPYSPTPHLEEAHVLVPHLHIPVGWHHLDVEELPGQSEHPVDDRGELEVGTQVLLLELVLGLPQTLGPEAGREGETRYGARAQGLWLGEWRVEDAGWGVRWRVQGAGFEAGRVG